MPDIALTNNATQGADQIGTPSVTIRSDGVPSNTQVELTDGTKLGLVQGILWSLRLDGYATCVIETIATPGEFRALAKNTTILVRPAPSYHPLHYVWDWYTAKFHRWFSAFHKVPAP